MVKKKLKQSLLPHGRNVSIQVIDPFPFRNSLFLFELKFYKEKADRLAMEKVQIKQISQLDQSHGDHLVLCFVLFHNLKTYCYLSLKQLEIIKKNFKVENLKEITERPTWFTEKRAKEEKFILNIGLLFMLNQKTQWSIDGAKTRLNNFKKIPVLQLLLSDQPEIFHNHKTNYSYKNINHFVRISDFDKMSEDSICIKIWQFTKPSELGNFLFGSTSKIANKLALEVFLEVKKDSIRIDFEFIRYILMCKKLFTSDELITLISKHKEIKQTKFYKEEWDMFCKRYWDSTGLVTFFSNIKEFKTKRRLLLNWNIPSHVMPNFDEVMEVAYPLFKVDLNKVSDVMYFYHNLGRDYGRKFIADFDLKHLQTYSNEIALLDNQKSGRFTLKIPKTYHDMVDWGATLCNCAGNFDQIEHYSEGLTIGVFDKDKIVYLIDYRNERIKQLKGFKNSLVKSREDLKEITQLFIDHKLAKTEDLKDLAKLGGPSW